MQLRLGVPKGRLVKAQPCSFCVLPSAADGDLMWPSWNNCPRDNEGRRARNCRCSVPDVGHSPVPVARWGSLPGSMLSSGTGTQFVSTKQTLVLKVWAPCLVMLITSANCYFCRSPNLKLLVFSQAPR